MHRFFFVLCLAACVSISLFTVTSAAPAPGAPIIVRPDAVKWTPVKGMTGLQSAVIYGDPRKAGSEYTVRYQAADGFKFPPHWHPMSEQVTVLSGTFLVGIGDKMNPAKMVTLPAGSLVWVPAKLHHYAWSKGVTVLEVHGIGPDQMTMVK